jgi:hydrogenase-1 operon protein HyaF
MNSLDRIGIKVVHEASEAQEAQEAQDPAMMRNGNTVAILHEVASLLDTLATTGQPGAVDLRSLPLLPGDYDDLQTHLGNGEVKATIEALGPTEVRETQYAGVWWVTYYDSDRKVMADRLEITFAPEILKSHPEDIRSAARRLRDVMQTETHTGDDHG